MTAPQRTARTPADGTRAEAVDVWLARLAVAGIAGLQMLLVNDLSPGPRWLAPAIELALLAPLSAATAWHHHGPGRHARAETRPDAFARHDRLIRGAALGLTGVVTLMNAGALVVLVRELLSGTFASGTALLVDAMNVWTVNVIVFALWFWGLDRRGDPDRGARADFLFPQSTLPRSIVPQPFRPGFVDYLFVSFTNATAFSPTDTLPLTHRAKLLMMVEATVSLLTVALVAARAVNVLR